MEIIIFPVFYGVVLLLFLGVVYAVTATMRRAWHPERRRDWVTLIVLLVLGLLGREYG